MLTREKIINGIYSCEHNTGYEHLDPVKVQNLADAILAEMEEPLAVLANSNGFSMRIGSNEKGVWFISLRKGHNTREQISAGTYATAEAKARQYLNTFTDKGEKI